MLTKQKISQQNVIKILSDYDLGRILQTRILPTSGSTMVFVKTEQGKFILRLSPKNLPMSRDREEILAEIELYEYLREKGFPVPKVVGTAIEFQGHYGYLREFISGQAVLRPNARKIRKAGAMLGKMHAITKGYKTKNKRKQAWDLQKMLKYFPSNKRLILNGKLKDKKKFVELFEQELCAIKFPKILPQGILHEDLGKRHVLWKGEIIVGVIDFDRSYYGALILDLGQALRGWCFTNNWTTWSKKNCQDFLKAYQRQRKVSVLEKKYLKDAVKFAILERAWSFALRFVKFGDREDEKYAWHSITKMLTQVDKKIPAKF